MVLLKCEACGKEPLTPPCIVVMEFKPQGRIMLYCDVLCLKEGADDLVMIEEHREKTGE